MKKVLLVMLVSFVVLVSMATGVLADYHKINESKRNDFNAILQHVQCRVALTGKQIDLFAVVDSNLTSNKAPLDEDIAKLKELADALNKRDFSVYLSTTFKGHLKNSADGLKEAKKDFRQANLTAEERKKLVDDHKAAIAEFATCVNNADKNWSESRAGYLDAWITRWNKIISDMKADGYNTTEMESVVSDAESRLLPALEALRNAASGTARKTAMENARNLHLHLWARFEIARIRSFLSSIEGNATTEGYSGDVLAIKAKLEEADNLAISGKRYREGEFENVWKTIHEAAKMLKDLNRKLKQ